MLPGAAEILPAGIAPTKDIVEVVISFGAFVLAALGLFLKTCHVLFKAVTLLGESHKAALADSNKMHADKMAQAMNMIHEGVTNAIQMSNENAHLMRKTQDRVAGVLERAVNVLERVEPHTLRLNGNGGNGKG